MTDMKRNLLRGTLPTVLRLHSNAAAVLISLCLQKDRNGNPSVESEFHQTFELHYYFFIPMSSAY